MNTPRTTLYRDDTNGKIFGVCAGIADYTGIDALWVRILFVGLTFAMFPLNLIGYGVLSFALSKKPAHLYAAPAEEKYWQGVRQSPKRTAREIRSRMKDIDRRLADVEAHYVSNNARLSAEIERLR